MLADVAGEEGDRERYETAPRAIDEILAHQVLAQQRCAAQVFVAGPLCDLGGPGGVVPQCCRAWRASVVKRPIPTDAASPSTPERSATCDDHRCPAQVRMKVWSTSGPMPLSAVMVIA
jgi:hypothetical protein